MSIESSLYTAPVGLDSLTGDDSSIEIEIVNPESVTLGVGEVEITLEPDDESGDFGTNLAEEMDAGELQKIAGDLISEIDADISSLGS
jgi:hypothetical protein